MKETERIPRIRADESKAGNLIGSMLQKERRSRSLTLDELCRALHDRGVDVQRGAISKWELGQTLPNCYQFLALCDIFSIEDPVAFFSGRQELNETGLRRLREYKEDLIDSGNYRPAVEKLHRAMISMPVSLLSASAGTGNFLDDGCFETLSFPEDTVPKNAEFGIRVCGDSMEPVYSNGQIVWVKQCSELRPGEVGIFIYDGDGYIKVYEEEQPDAGACADSFDSVRPQPLLISYNKKYRPIHVSAEKPLRIVGRVL